MFDAICEAMHRELNKLDEKYEDGNPMTSQELDDINKMTHALKSIATYEAMKEGKRDRRRYYESDYRRY